MKLDVFSINRERGLAFQVMCKNVSAFQNTFQCTTESQIIPHPWSAVYVTSSLMGLLPDTQKCMLCMRRECRECLPRNYGLAIPTCITARAWRTPGSLSSVFLWSGWILGACATRNFAYLVRGPRSETLLNHKLEIVYLLHTNWSTAIVKYIWSDFMGTWFTIKN